MQQTDWSENIFIISLNIHDMGSLMHVTCNVVSLDLLGHDISKGDQVRCVILIGLIRGSRCSVELD